MRYLIAVFVLSLIAFALMIAPHLAKAGSGASGILNQSLQIVQDEQTQSFRFVIEGEEVARIDKQGFHVRNDIEYGGAVSDVGVGSYDKAPASPQGAAE